MTSEPYYGECPWCHADHGLDDKVQELAGKPQTCAACGKQFEFGYDTGCEEDIDAFFPYIYKYPS